MAGIDMSGRDWLSVSIASCFTVATVCLLTSTIKIPQQSEGVRIARKNEKDGCMTRTDIAPQILISLTICER